MNIFITSVGTATSVNLIKYFKKAGDYIVGGDINEYGYTAGSIMCHEYVQLPYATDSSYFDKVCNIIKLFNIELFIPVNDIEVYIAAEHIKDIPCKCIIPDFETISKVRDKYICSSSLSGIVDVPKILENDDVNKNRILRDRLGVGSKGITYIDKGTEAPAYNKDERFLQETVDGEEYTVDLLCDLAGHPIYIIPRLRLEVKGGVATKVKVCNDDELILQVKKILEVYKLPGFSNIQFIKGQDSKYYFIEINYRFSGCGVGSLLSSPNYLEHFKAVSLGGIYNGDVNPDTKFNLIVTRYYEEMVYEDRNS